MSKQQIIDQFATSLTATIQKWMDENCESKEWIALDSYIGDDTARLMAKASLTVLEGIIDVQDYLKADNITADN